MFWLSYAHAGSFMPVQATKIAAQYDTLYAFLVWISAIASLMVIVGFIYFAMKYRRQSDNDKTAYISHNSLLEFLWSFIPFVLFMVFFVWGAILYRDMRHSPSDSMEILVEGQKWNWTITYKSGKVSPAELVVPVNTPIKLVMTSKDVLHSFFIPAFRIKQDVVPGRYTKLSFTANMLGNFQVFCAEYCGDQHSTMLAKVRVVPREEFDLWLQTDPYKGLSVADVGKKVFETRCVACHSLGENKLVGPGWLGLFGKPRHFEGGTSAVADENYIRESILNPTAKIVAGFAPAMPTFAGQLSEQEISGVIEMIKTLRKP
jgi:cytochrome c oxidase subunit II